VVISRDLGKILDTPVAGFSPESMCYLVLGSVLNSAYRWFNSTRSHHNVLDFLPPAVELCVRWRVTYRLNYRDLVAMTVGPGIVVLHTTNIR